MEAGIRARGETGTGAIKNNENRIACGKNAVKGTGSVKDE
jgi:hypothetical protein